jgi:hypothetical protein
MPTTSFWTSEEKIPIAQKKVSVQAENGLSYNLGQQINFVIPPTIGFFMPSETYLRMDVKIKYPTGFKGQPLTLDGDIGTNVLIRDIRISSGGAQNQILEEIQNVNILTALKYDYETNDNLRKKRAMTEGVILESNVSRPNNNGTATNMNNLDTNPYFTRADGGKTLADSEYKTVKALLKLPTGIFQNDRVFPLQMTQGLRIEIILEDPNRVFRQLETTLKHKRVTSNPVFHSLSGSNASRTSWATSASASSFYLERHNGVISVESCPFAVGDTVAFVNPREVDIDAPGDSLIPADGSASTAVCKAVITNIEYDATAGGGSDTTGLVKVTVTEVQNLWHEAITPSATKPFYVYSAGVELSTSYNPTCSVDNVELQVQQVEMPAGYVSKMNSMLKAGGAMNYDFLSFTNYKYSQLQSDRVVNIRLPIQNSRCKAILAIPTDATPYSAKDSISAENTYLVNNITRDTGGGDYSYNRSTRSGLVGIADHASNYQFIYAGKLNPNRKVPLGRMSINLSNEQPLNQQLFIENEKALRMSNIDPLSFTKYQENFFIGRALSLSSGIYDARGKDFNLQVEYQEASGPTKAKLWNCFVSHLRRIVVRGDQIALEV